MLTFVAFNPRRLEVPDGEIRTEYFVERQRNTGVFFIRVFTKHINAIQSILQRRGSSGYSEIVASVTRTTLVRLKLIRVYLVRLEASI